MLLLNGFHHVVFFNLRCLPNVWIFNYAQWMTFSSGFISFPRIPQKKRLNPCEPKKMNDPQSTVHSSNYFSCSGRSLGVVISSITPKPYILQKISFQFVANILRDKGQLISKGLLVVFIWTKKRTKNFCPEFFFSEIWS